MPGRSCAATGLAERQSPDPTGRHTKKKPAQGGPFIASVVNHSVMHDPTMHRVMHRTMMDHTVMHRMMHNVVNRLRHDRRGHQTQTQRKTHTQ